MKKLLIAALVGTLGFSSLACASRKNVRTMEFMGEEVALVDCDTFDIRALEDTEAAEKFGTRWITQAQLNKAIAEEAKKDGTEAMVPLAMGIFNGMVSSACAS